MTLKELRERIEAVPKGEFYDNLNVCIPNNKDSIGPISTTDVKAAGQGIDWNNKKFFIWPEKEMIEKPQNK